MTDAGFLFGPLGLMQPLGEVQAGVTMESTRGRGELITPAGVRYVQKSRHAPRSWSLSYVWQSPNAVRLLTAAAQGVVKDCWLYDVAGARANMLPPYLTAGNGPLVSVAGVPMGSLTAGTVATVPVLAGRTYTVSGWSAHAAGATTFTYKLGSGSTANAIAPPGAGPRPTTASFTPSVDQTLTVAVSSGTMSGLRVHEGSPDGDWLPGEGTPCRVDVLDPQKVLQLVADRHSVADYTISLQEVGIPGVI